MKVPFILTLLVLAVSASGMGKFPKGGSEPVTPVTPTKVAPAAPKPPVVKVITGKPVDIQQTLVSIASEYLYVRESNGPNRSKDIDAWNRATGVPLGSPYCASFQAHVHTRAGLKNPNSAWSPAWFPADKQIPYSKLSKGDVVGLYYSSLKRVGHILMVDEVQKSTVITLEANTSPSAAAGSNSDRDGDGTWRKYRSQALMSNSRNKCARWWAN